MVLEGTSRPPRRRGTTARWGASTSPPSPRQGSGAERFKSFFLLIFTNMKEDVDPKVNYFELNRDGGFTRELVVRWEDVGVGGSDDVCSFLAVLAADGAVGFFYLKVPAGVFHRLKVRRNAVRVSPTVVILLASSRVRTPSPWASRTPPGGPPGRAGGSSPTTGWTSTGTSGTTTGPASSRSLKTPCFPLYIRFWTFSGTRWAPTPPYCSTPCPPASRPQGPAASASRPGTRGLLTPATGARKLRR